MNPTRNRSSLIYILFIVAIAILLFFNFQQDISSQEALTINEVAMQIKNGEITRIVEDENQLRVIYKDGSEATSQKEQTATLVEQLKELGVTTEDLNPERVKVEIKPPGAWVGIITIFSYMAPLFCWLPCSGLSSGRLKAATMLPWHLENPGPA